MEEARQARKPGTGSLACPAQGSLRSILIENATTLTRYRHQKASRPSAGHVSSRIPRSIYDDLLQLRVSWCQSDKDSIARRIVRKLAEEGHPQNNIGPGKLSVHYNQKPVCTINLPLVARYGSRILWAYVDSTWIWNERAKARTHKDFIASYRKDQDRKEDLLPIHPFCVAAIIAIAQQQTPSQSSTLFVTRYIELLSKVVGDKPRLITAIFEYTVKVPKLYLKKFSHPYKYYDSELVVQRRAFALAEENIPLFSQAVKDLGA
ncbi:hypothetical protein BP5796_13163 [Coleophoma crateriformis]|uniref:Uncharacterized protein n=1 Tax=Coleophoma crateriformis TaxID=565419 RepID=A0A3D8Q3V6_9HELO|nr:hypothetical protein BP5796_13163 [Coleophoma crateriformis]